MLRPNLNRVVRIVFLLAFLLLPSKVLATPSEPIIHVVQWGETLGYIAQLYHTSIAALVQANNLANPDFILVGQRLVIPTAEPSASTIPPATTHIVQAGETLSLIAARYGTTVEALTQANGLNNPDLIPAGYALAIPLPITGTVTALPAGPITGITLTPSPVRQGQTLLITITTSRPVTLTGALEGQKLDFAPLTRASSGHTRQYWALAGIHALAQPGPRTVYLAASYESGQAQAQTVAWIIEGEYRTDYISLSQDKAELLNPELVQAEAARLAEIFKESDSVAHWQGLFRIPLDTPLRITSAFGNRRAYAGQPPSGFHTGVDLGAAEGTLVLASAAGRVALAEPLTVRGQTVIIDHGRGVYTGYWHLSAILVKAGQQIERGAPIGRVGSTGLSTGPHLHWELRVGGIAVDPMQWTQQAFPHP